MRSKAELPPLHYDIMGDLIDNKGLLSSSTYMYIRMGCPRPDQYPITSSYPITTLVLARSHIVICFAFSSIFFKGLLQVVFTSCMR